MICGKCNKEQNSMKKIKYGDKPDEFSYWCPNCKDKISPIACYNGDKKDEK